MQYKELRHVSNFLVTFLLWPGEKVGPARGKIFPRRKNEKKASIVSDDK